MAKNNNLKDFVTGVAGAIREKKGTTELINPQDFENEIRTIQTGTDTSDATATADDIRLGKTAYGATGKMTGTIADYDGSSEPASGKSLFAQLVDKSITNVSASDLTGMTRIGQYAFFDCESLTSITIPDSVTNIGFSAFSSCSSLTSITIPDGVTNIDNAAFQSCTGLTSITIPNSVTSIDGYVFSGCRSLTNITIPDSVTSIDRYAFSGCSNLTSVTIGNGVTSVGDRAFISSSTNTELGGTYVILATTPPTIQSTTFQVAKINKIIVPKGTLDAYKSATNWSAYADKMVEASE